MTTWTVVRYLHLLALVFFVGGQLMLAVAVAPIMRRAGHEEAMRDMAKRFGIGSVVALALAIATGIAMASHYRLWDDPTLHAKLGVLVVIAVLLGLHTRTPYTRAVSIVTLVLSLVLVYLGVHLAHG